GGKREVRLKGECVFHTPGGAGVQLAEIPASTKIEIDALLAAAATAPAAESKPAVVTPPPPPEAASAPAPAAARAPAGAPPARAPATASPAVVGARTSASTDLAPAGDPFEGELVEVLREAEVEGEARVEGQVGGRASWLKVLARLQTVRATGVLTAERKGEVKNFLVYQGRLVDSEGKPPRHDETLFAVCRKLQLLKPGPLRILEKALDSAKGMDEFDAAAAAGIFNAQEHDRARRWQLNERASDVFAWEKGRYRFDPQGDRSWGRPTSGISAGQVILHGVRSFIRASGEDLARVMQPAMDRALTVVANSGFEPGKAGMSDKEIRFWADIDGKKSLRALLQTSPLPQSQAQRLVFALARLGVLAFAGAPVAKAKEDPAEAMRARLSDIRGRTDAFARLGLSWMASGQQVKAAFEQLRREYGDIVRAGGPQAAVAKDILTVLEGAFREVSDERLRRAVRLKVVGDPARIEASAEMLAEKADILHLRGDPSGAVSTLQMAIDLDPANEAVKKVAAKLNVR
ncbi:MAG TPA: DUF4388 domain-containing protein, partial [bacterium]|nr:DUF4388 domain-containing protein [bacterium]